MKVRVITSIFILAVAIPVVTFSEYIVYPIVLSLLSGIAVFEMLRVIGLQKCWSLAIPAYAIALAAPICSYFMTDAHRIFYLLAVFVVLFCYLIYTMAVAVFSKGTIPVSKLGVVYLSVTYVVASFTSMSTVRYMESGLYILFLIFFISWGCDACAYLVGTLCGKHKLIPEVSPKKSVEGAVGGVVGAVILNVALLFVFKKFFFEGETGLSYISVIIMSICLSVISMFGDLAASTIKRNFGIKDFGKLLPGHGGIMDRCDSLLFVLPVLYSLVYIINLF
jgi:phosphatidate cytidylyltransferase